VLERDKPLGDDSYGTSDKRKKCSHCESEFDALLEWSKYTHQRKCNQKRPSDIGEPLVAWLSPSSFEGLEICRRVWQI
jgi:hypothetical protein